MPVSPRRHDLLKSRSDRFTKLLPGVEEGDVRAIHQARVASRRLREVLPVLQLDRDTTRKLVRRLRNVTRQLGHVRELDVLLPLIDELRESRRGSSQGLKRVADAVQVTRAKARERLAGKVSQTDLQRVERKLDQAVKALERAEKAKPSPRAWRWAIDARIARRASAVQRAIDQAGAVYLPERLHTVRIALKKLRYSVETSAEAAGSKGNADLRQLRKTQELLGRMHDLQVLIGYVRREQASLAPPDVAMWRDLDALVASLENDCRRLHARYVRDRLVLRAMCERLAARLIPSESARRVG
jgi:CHAD domain-containing protein